MNKEAQDIKQLQRLIKLKNLFAQIKQLSWNVSTTEKRYPAPEAMTFTELEELTKLFLALGFDLESAAKEWKKFYKEYKEENAGKI